MRLSCDSSFVSHPAGICFCPVFFALKKLQIAGGIFGVGEAVILSTITMHSTTMPPQKHLLHPPFFLNTTSKNTVKSVKSVR
jgi:hypothetical protein